MIKKIIYIIFITVFTLGLYANKVFCANYYLLTDIGTSARSISLGSIEGFSEAANTVFENPAGMYRIDSAAASFFTTTIMDEVYYNSVAVCSDTPIGKFGVGYMEASIYDIPHTGLNTSDRLYVKSYFDFKNYLYKLSYAYSLNRNIHLGASLVNYSTEFWEIKGKGSDLDLGCIVDYDDLELSFIARNAFSGDVTFNNDGKEVLLARYIFSGKYTYDEFEIFGQIRDKETKKLLSIGLSYKPRLIPYFEINAGHKEFLVLNRVKKNLTLGVGLNISGIGFYYAYEKSEHFEYDNKNYFSVNINL
jgi:hypothetical protein